MGRALQAAERSPASLTLALAGWGRLLGSAAANTAARRRGQGLA